MNKDIKVKDLIRHYDEQFRPTKEYRDSIPDLQNDEYSDIPIEFVGIQDFKVPLRIRQKDGDTQEVMASITGTVSLESEKRGINMSRIIRTFYKSKDDVFDVPTIEKVLRDYRKDLQSFDAHLLINFEYRIWQDALRSVRDDGTPEGGWQYYNVTFDVNLDKTGEFKRVLWVDFIYSSACPCSTELSQHAAYQRGVFGIPHSQRSLARLGLEFDLSEDNTVLWIEDIIDMCREALTTETLVFCKREDEQAFAEKNGAQPKFVEDAIRCLSHTLNESQLVTDYKVICSHQESLHSHNAIAVTTKGKKNSIFNHHVTLGEFQSMKV
jgi:GTP cyclohydrolase IB